MMKRELFNTIIIGAGNIGALYDSPNSVNILSHAHGFSKHPGFELVGFIDIDSAKAKRAAKIWNCRFFKDIEEALSAESIDVVSIAVPDEYHYSTLLELLKLNIKFIFTEKPLAKTPVEAKDVISIQENTNIGIAVNYSRRYVPEFERLKHEISSQLYGKFITGSGYYGKGILHNGSHMIDLLRFLVNEIDSAIPIQSSYDFYKDDPSISAILNFIDGRKFFLQYVECKNYTIFEVDLLFERGRIKITNSGFNIEIYEIKESSIFKGYKNIFKIKEISTSLNNSIYYAVDNIYKYLTEGYKIDCDLYDGLKAVEICNMLKESLGGNK